MNVPPCRSSAVSRRARLGLDLGPAVSGALPLKLTGKIGADSRLGIEADLTALKLAVNSDPIKVVNNPIALFATSAKLFTDYGFKECGKT